MFVFGEVAAGYDVSFSGLSRWAAKEHHTLGIGCRIHKRAADLLQQGSKPADSYSVVFHFDEEGAAQPQVPSEDGVAAVQRRPKLYCPGKLVHLVMGGWPPVAEWGRWGL